MTMPEAAVHKDDGTVLRQYKVGFAINPSGMKAVSEAKSMERLAKSQLWPCIPAADTGHHAGSGLTVNNVRHFRPLLLRFLASASEPGIRPVCLRREVKDLPATFGIIDLFAGPGGLGEGFASLEVGGHFPFHIGISVEKEASAHRTLTLRAFLRANRRRHGALPQAFVDLHAGLIGEPDWAFVDPSSWSHAEREARCLELGTDAAAQAIDRVIARLGRKHDDTILIGGPPCQAYSLVGRARAKGKIDYIPEKDERHYLFREYINVLERLRPAVFVMENVKGILSSTVESRLVFEMLMEDLASLGTRQGHHYELRAIRIANGRASLQAARQPADFVVRAEEFGIPQRRHRVIILGFRADIAARLTGADIAVPGPVRTVTVSRHRAGRDIR